MIDTLLTEIADRYGLRRGSNRWSGPCPKCGGSKDSDKFVIKDDGGFKCYSCDFRGDIITWLRQIDGKTCPEAHEAAGLPCRADSCPVRGTCRMGDGSGRRSTPAARSLTPPRAHQGQNLPTIAPRQPADTWQTWASNLVTTAAATLANCPDVLAWLAGRGIDAAAAARFRLGWLGHDRRLDRAALALPPKDGKDKLWVPGGLVIPTPGIAGQVHRLRIRRTTEARARFRDDLKYVWLEGSGNEPLWIAPTGSNRGAVIVEAELDAMAVASAHPQVTVIAIGTVSGGLTAAQRDSLAAAPTILVALDADPGQDGSPGAGPKNIERWLTTYRQARYWPTPTAKDPGDYVTAGGNLRAWIEAGLVPEIPAAHDLAFTAGCIPPGGEGREEVQQVQDDPAIAPGPKHYVMPLPDGREIHVTDDEPLWRELTAAGHIAFSENELIRLQTATAALPEAERLAAALLAVDVKQQFSGAYIRRGEATA